MIKLQTIAIIFGILPIAAILGIFKNRVKKEKQKLFTSIRVGFLLLQLIAMFTILFTNQ